MKIQKKLLLGAALVAASISAQAQTATTKPVGYRTETLLPGFNLIGVNLAEKVEAAGALDAGTGASAAVDTDTNFSSLAGAPLILKFTSGPALSATYQVSASAGTPNTLTPAGGSFSIVPAVGNTYELRKLVTVGGLFPAPSYGGLRSGDEAVNADQIFVSNGAGFDVFWLSNGDIEGAGWRRLDNNADASAEPISYTESFLIKNTRATNTAITFVGHVVPSASLVGVQGAGFTYVSRVLPVASVKLDDLTGLAAGDEAPNADQVFIPSGPGLYTVHWLSNGDIEAAGWRRLDNNAASGTSLLTSGVIVKRKGAAGAVNIAIPSGLDI